MRKPPQQPTTPPPAIVLALVFLLTLGAIAAPARAQTPLNGSLDIHDPSTIIKQGDRYYMFGTGDGIRIEVVDRQDPLEQRARGVRRSAGVDDRGRARL